MRKTGRIIAVLLATLLWSAGIGLAAWVESQDGRVFIVDHKGERWDVTQAQELGFIPQRFKYGIGKDAFTPLKDEGFGKKQSSVYSDTRIIGISVDDDAHAYAVSRLRHHEIANTTLAGKAISAGY